MKVLREFLDRRLIRPLLEQLRQGATPGRLAWSVALGGAIGLFPVLGSTTFLCAGAGLLFRLNHVAMQTINYLAYAFQLVLIPAFIRLGEKLLGADPIRIDLVEMKARFLESPGLFFQDFGMAAVHGIIAWAIILPVPTWITAHLLERLFSKISRRPEPRSDSSTPRGPAVPPSP